jgi:hypothetical protein
MCLAPWSWSGAGKTGAEQSQTPPKAFFRVGPARWPDWPIGLGRPVPYPAMPSSGSGYGGGRTDRGGESLREGDPGGSHGGDERKRGRSRRRATPRWAAQISRPAPRRREGGQASGSALRSRQRRSARLPLPHPAAMVAEPRGGREGREGEEAQGRGRGGGAGGWRQHWCRAEGWGEWRIRVRVEDRKFIY